MSISYSNGIEVVTVCIRIVADCETRISQETTKFHACYNVNIYYYFGYSFYILLPIELFPTYSGINKILLELFPFSKNSCAFFPSDNLN